MRRLSAFLGLDRAVAYTVLWRSWSALVAPVTLVLVATFLSPVAQGFFYTFSSIAALQVIFELGLSQLILQFTSHERSRLHWEPDGRLGGDRHAWSRLASLLRSALRWYATAAVLVVAVLLPAGLRLFATRAAEAASLEWALPWTLFVVLSAGSFALLPVVAVVEGCGRVADVALMRLTQTILANGAMWLVLLLHGGLYALVAIRAVDVGWTLAWLLTRHRGLLADLLAPGRRPVETVSWRREIWPLQWRTALVWASSAFITPLFNPILFAFHGAAEAGRMGLSVSIVTAINAVGLAWVQTKAPAFGVLVARRQFAELDRLFFPALAKSAVVVLASCLVVLAVTARLAATGHPLAARILPPIPLVLLLATAVVLHVIYAEAVYLRAHKAEPFVAVAVVASLLTGSASWLLG
ncbi:MAG TPA: hypothetical protein VNK43_10960, partial [Gemmatimonadales bacterium]|nr:hypothetical protein [Gemmatimonadales bacterium]